MWNIAARKQLLHLKLKLFVLLSISFVGFLMGLLGEPAERNGNRQKGGEDRREREGARITLTNWGKSLYNTSYRHRYSRDRLLHSICSPSYKQFYALTKHCQYFKGTKMNSVGSGAKKLHWLMWHINFRPNGPIKPSARCPSRRWTNWRITLYALQWIF